MDVFSKFKDKPALDTVFYEYIWPLLSYNDLLRIRRVSKHARNAVTSYLKAKPEIAPYIEINEDSKQIGDFLAMDMPTTKLFINNNRTGPKYYYINNQGVGDLLERYGPKITHLKVDTLLDSMNIWVEGIFLNGLPNLEVLTANKWIPVNSKLEKYINRKFKPNPPLKLDSMTGSIPTLYTELKTFDIGRCLGTSSEGESLFENWAIQLHEVLFAPKLESLIIPAWFSIQDTTRFKIDLGVLFGSLDYMRYPNKKDGPPRMKCLKQISFQNLEYDTRGILKDDVVASCNFIDKLARRCARDGVSLEMVNALWFLGARLVPNINGDVGSCVVSMKNINPVVLDWLKLPNLKRLDVYTRTSCLEPSPEMNHANEYQVDPGAIRSSWLTLETLNIFVNSIEMGDMDEVRPSPEANVPINRFAFVHYRRSPVKKLFTFLFKDIVRVSLTELSLNFENLPGVYTPNPNMAETMAKSCCNLKVLRLTNWKGTNKSLTKLWEGMTSLEDVTLKNCVGLGNVAFVGEGETPVFLGLSRLKRLSLIGLDKMPKITDTLFRLVLSQLKLTHLVLSSSDPVKSLTKETLHCLLKGPFSETVVKFPFDGWRISGVSDREWIVLSKLFRSYRMN